MLKNIHLHIEKDEQNQGELEKKLADHIALTQHENINAFQRHIPSLMPYIENAKSKNISLICNKFSKFNMVDFGNGRVFYGFDPEGEVDAQVNDFCLHPCLVNFSDSQKQAEDETPENESAANTLTKIPAYQQYQNAAPVIDTPELIVVLGLGLGYHIKLLIQNLNVKHLIIYEPEIQYFNCSIAVNMWREILELAKIKGTALYFQLEKDGRDILKDITELRQHFDINGFYLYQHYHCPVFNSINQEVRNNSWTRLVQNGISFNLVEKNAEFCPIWTPPINFSNYKLTTSSNPKFLKNLEAFKQYFPAIYTEFKDYQPKVWQPIESLESDGAVNLIKLDNLVPWYSDTPKQDCLQNLENYVAHPHKDGLALGYKGKKLKHYLHYQFVAETETLLDEIIEDVGELPSTIKSIIMFGLGAGYQLEKLINDRSVEKLFLCEPNRDFFYASLFAIDWVSILKKVDDENGRIYINIGDDGTNLFRDLLNQFYAIGPYILNQTYFYQAYYNSSLNLAISQLREQLQVVIAMGEYFDHAYYGISHTQEGIKRTYPHMLKNPSQYLSFDDKEVPVFLVGNGPSLDYSIEAIKEWKGSAIVVSCGTALQVLYKHGIKPDFHAEIEQNRSTYDWALRIGDPDYLKSITLISCNGIHPDTCDLYDKVLIAFKDGESSTVSAQHMFDKDLYESLRFAFPTVTNFAINFFIQLGFLELYLFGVDLGFVDNKNHHSKLSGYFDSHGNPLYDYNENNNTSLVVPGNFRTTVMTKHEFKVSKMVVEQSIAKAGIAVYNTSDGAKINGAIALPIDSLLIVATPQQKTTSLNKMLVNCFTVEPLIQHKENDQSFYSISDLRKEAAMFKRRIEHEVKQIEDAEGLIESQKKMLFASYSEGKSLLFYYLYGTVNYANVILNKLTYSHKEKGFSAQKFNAGKDIWLHYFTQISQKITQSSLPFDGTSSFTASRVNAMLKYVLDEVSIAVITNSEDFAKTTEALIDQMMLDKCKIVCHCFDLSNLPAQKEYDYVMYFADDRLIGEAKYLDLYNNKLPAIGRLGTLIYLNQERFLGFEPQADWAEMNIAIYVSPISMPSSTGVACTMTTTSAFMINCSLDSDKFVVFLPKFRILKGTQHKVYSEPLINLIADKPYVYEFYDYIGISNESIDYRNLIGKTGHRGSQVLKKLENKDFVLHQYEEKEFKLALKLLNSQQNDSGVIEYVQQ
jgi:hypothetical protein